MEWEKAARGVDARSYPWGEYFDPSWALSRYSHVTRPLPTVVRSYPVDCSPYGVRGLAGNVIDWCRNRHVEDLFADGPGRDDATDTVFYGLRGGSWDHTSLACRSMLRGRHEPLYRGYFLSFRVTRPLPG